MQMDASLNMEASKIFKILNHHQVFKFFYIELRDPLRPHIRDMIENIFSSLRLCRSSFPNSSAPLHIQSIPSERLAKIDYSNQNG